MRTGLGRDFELRSPNGRVSIANTALCASKHRISRSAATRLLRIQQAPPDHVQIGECGRDFQAVQVLRKTPVADLLEAEHSLDHADGVLDLRSDARLVAVRGLDLFV